MKKVFAVTAALALLCLGGIAQANITIATVPVGNPGNAPDTRVMNDGTTGYGSVAYNYNIGKYDVTAGRYTAFLNAVAATDTYACYNTTMAGTNLAPTYGCGISRSGSSGSYVYSVADPNLPVVDVTYWDACRFANWLDNGQPVGVQERAPPRPAHTLYPATPALMVLLSRETPVQRGVYQLKTNGIRLHTIRAGGPTQDTGRMRLKAILLRRLLPP